MENKKQEEKKTTVNGVVLPERLAALAALKLNNGKPQGGGHGPGGWHRQLEQAHDSKATFFRLLGFLRGRLPLMIAVAILVILGTLLNLASPWLLGQAVDSLKVSINGVLVDMQRLLTIICLMAFVYGFNSLVQFLQGWTSAKIAQDTVRLLRQKLFMKLQLLPLTYFDTHSHGEVLSRATNDIEVVAQVLSRGVVNFIGSLITVIGSLFVMLKMSPTLTVVTLLTIPGSFFLTKFASKKIRSSFLAQQTMVGLLNGHVEEVVSARKTVKAFNHEKQAMEDFTVLNRELCRVWLRTRFLMGAVWPLMSFLNNIGYALLAGCGGWLVSRGSISVGVIAAFIQYSRQFTRPVSEIANQYNEIQSALAGAERVFTVLDETEEEPVKPSGRLDDIRGDIVFDNVEFAYKAGEPVLKGFSSHVLPGQKIALVGTTGAGKTTVASLLMRFYNIQSGRILLDGKDLTDIPRRDVRRSIAMVLQETQLFSGSMRDNIRFGRLDATDDEVVAAAKLSGADLFIQRMPDGYDTVLSENGGNLSQGQRQLLSITRAILADPPILILDEATSSVDTRTELLIQRAMVQLMKGRTCIVIAHRLSTIRDADSIMVMDGGRIAEQGKHAELVEKRGIYWTLEQSQMGVYCAANI
ncbi:MAG: ABC transporter ATP-binding protein [Victivallales bacterium]|nr:ABC transporter ATP-binding protein [Victivallales bacterium]